MRTTPTLKTTIVTYNLNLSKAEDKAEHLKICKRLEKQGLKLFPTNSFQVKREYIEGLLKAKRRKIALETAHLFSDQWNSTDQRLFDWFEVAYPNCNIKKGYYLVQTLEMREIRKNTLVCGYCGKYEMSDCGHDFCNKCMGSKHLEQTSLFLLRLLPVAINMPNRARLTDEESARLVPLFTDCQTHYREIRKVERVRKQRASIEDKYHAGQIALDEERSGKLWILDHDLNLDNVLYYSHNGKFGFGWRSPVSEAVKAELEKVLTNEHEPFPYEYEIKST